MRDKNRNRSNRFTAHDEIRSEERTISTFCPELSFLPNQMQGFEQNEGTTVSFATTRSFRLS